MHDNPHRGTPYGKNGLSRKGLLSMWIILWLLFGALVGWLASIITKKNSRMGAGANIIVGLLGSLIGGFLAQLLGLGSYSQFSFWGLLISIAGAVLLIWIISLFRRGKREA